MLQKKKLEEEAAKLPEPMKPKAVKANRPEPCVPRENARSRRRPKYSIAQTHYMFHHCRKMKREVRNLQRSEDSSSSDSEEEPEEPPQHFSPGFEPEMDYYEVVEDDDDDDEEEDEEEIEEVDHYPVYGCSK